MRAKYILIGVVVGVLLSSAAIVLAGGLNPPSGPTDATSQMYTLEQIYQRLNDGTAATKMTSFTEPASGPGTGTMHTLDDIMAVAPAADNANGALPAEVLAGKTYWGLRTDGTWGNRTGTRVPAPVPKTGQTTPNSGGDDGELQKGVAWPNPRLTDNLDGTVTDNLTGLIWLKDANCFGPRKWTTALTDANTLNNGECGLGDGSAEGDWRLPNVREMQSQKDYGQWSPALPSGHPFSGIPSSGQHWSSTTHANYPDYAYYVDLRECYVSGVTKNNTAYVWPVRGGQ